MIIKILFNNIKGIKMNKVEQIFSDNKDTVSFCKGYTKHFSSLLEGLDYDALGRLVDAMMKCRENSRKIIFIGNGGSAATSSHFANDIAIGTREYEKPFKALSLTDNNAIITAIGNNNGYDEIFKKQLQVYMEPGDIVIAISASGNSPNLLKAIEYANSKDNKTYGLLGFDGGQLKRLCSDCLVVETDKGEYGPVEDVHMILDHMIGNFLYLKIRE